MSVSACLRSPALANRKVRSSSRMARLSTSVDVSSATMYIVRPFYRDLSTTAFKDFNCYINNARRKKRSDLLAPFDDGNPPTEQDIIRTDQFKLICRIQPVQIDMIQRSAGHRSLVCNILVDYRVARAGDRFGDADSPGEATDECSLPCTQCAMQTNNAVLLWITSQLCNSRGEVLTDLLGLRRGGCDRNALAQGSFPPRSSAVTCFLSSSTTGISG